MGPRLKGFPTVEFSPLRTRLVVDEASTVDYWMWVQIRSIDFYSHFPRTTAAPGDYDALQQQFTAVTGIIMVFLILSCRSNLIVRLGRQPTPPDFILGYQQSKLRYFNETQILDLAQRFHDEKVNVSLIVVGGYRLCHKIWDYFWTVSSDFFAWKFQGDWYAPVSMPVHEGLKRYL